MFFVLFSSNNVNAEVCFLPTGCDPVVNDDKDDDRSEIISDISCKQKNAFDSNSDCSKNIKNKKLQKCERITGCYYLRCVYADLKGCKRALSIGKECVKDTKTGCFKIENIKYDDTDSKLNEDNGKNDNNIENDFGDNKIPSDNMEENNDSNASENDNETSESNNYDNTDKTPSIGDDKNDKDDNETSGSDNYDDAYKTPSIDDDKNDKDESETSGSDNYDDAYKTPSIGDDKNDKDESETSGSDNYGDTDKTPSIGDDKNDKDESETSGSDNYGDSDKAPSLDDDKNDKDDRETSGSDNYDNADKAPSIGNVGGKTNDEKDEDESSFDRYDEEEDEDKFPYVEKDEEPSIEQRDDGEAKEVKNEDNFANEDNVAASNSEIPNSGTALVDGDSSVFDSYANLFDLKAKDCSSYFISKEQVASLTDYSCFVCPFDDNWYRCLKKEDIKNAEIIDASLCYGYNLTNASCLDEKNSKVFSDTWECKVCPHDETKYKLVAKPCPEGFVRAIEYADCSLVGNVVTDNISSTENSLIEYDVYTLISPVKGFVQNCKNNVGGVSLRFRCASSFRSGDEFCVEDKITHFVKDCFDDQDSDLEGNKIPRCENGELFYPACIDDLLNNQKNDL